MTPGVLTVNTVLNFNCGNDPGVVPGVCNGFYTNQEAATRPPTQELCDQGYTSGSLQMSDGRYRWRCSGAGNPQLNPAGGTQTCYTLPSGSQKKNQSPLVLSAKNWTITSGGSQAFSVVGGSGDGAVSISKVDSVGHAICSISTTSQNPGWRVTATATPGTKGNGACIIWANKSGTTNYYSVETSPVVFNVQSQ